MKHWQFLSLTFLVVTLCAYAGISSYQSEKLLVTVPSQYNGSVRVFEDRAGVRRMRFTDDSMQSAYDTREPGRVVIPYMGPVVFAGAPFRGRDCGRGIVLAGQGQVAHDRPQNFVANLCPKRVPNRLFSDHWRPNGRRQEK